LITNLTISEAFSVKCEEINVNGEVPPNLDGKTAQIYNDSLYVYGGVNERNKPEPERNLWCFDLSKRNFDQNIP